MEKNKGIMIVFEGGEGTGKTTAIEKVYSSLKEKGNIKVIKTREPGGSEIAEKIREIIVDKNNTDIDPKTEALLFAAARRQHLVEKVIPYLEKGYIVLCDRYIASSLAYQGYARGLGIPEVLSMNEFGMGDYIPDLTLWFDVEPEVGLKRIIDNNRVTNRIDNEKLEFHKKVYAGYIALLSTDFGNMARINANNSKEDVFKNCMRIINNFIKDNYVKTELQQRIELYCHKYGIEKMSDTFYGSNEARLVSESYTMKLGYDMIAVYHGLNIEEEIHFDKQSEKILKIVCYNDKCKIETKYYYDNDNYDVIENEYKNNKPYRWRYFKNGKAIKIVCVEKNDFKVITPDLNGELN